MNTKTADIIDDLYKILYRTNLASAPDNHDILRAMAKCLINHHGIKFRDLRPEFEEMFWLDTCPNPVPKQPDFSNLCRGYLDFEPEYRRVDPQPTWMDIYGNLHAGPCFG